MNRLFAAAVTSCLLVSLASIEISAKESEIAKLPRDDKANTISFLTLELEDQLIREVSAGSQGKALALDAVLNTLSKLEDNGINDSATIFYDANGNAAGLVIRDVFGNVSGFIIWPEYDAVSGMDLGSGRTDEAILLGLINFDDHVREDFEIISGLDLGSGR